MVDAVESHLAESVQPSPRLTWSTLRVWWVGDIVSREERLDLRQHRSGLIARPFSVSVGIETTEDGEFVSSTPHDAVEVSCCLELATRRIPQDHMAPVVGDEKKSHTENSRLRKGGCWREGAGCYHPRMRRPSSKWALATILACAVFATALPAMAASPVDVVDDEFKPRNVTIKWDGSVKWTFHGPTFHTVTDATGMSDYDSGLQNSGDTFTQPYDWAGTYPYRCTEHEGMTGKVRVKMTGSILRGNRGKIFLSWGGDPPDGFVTDVEVKPPGETWTSWIEGSEGIAFGSFDPGGDGRYAFRARLRQTYGSEPVTGWSPPTRIKV